VREAEVILYDEPTSGLDPVTSVHISKLISDLNRKHKVTSVVVTHDMVLAVKTATRIMLVKDGKAVVCLPPEEFLKSDIPEVRSFIAASKGEEI
jgi:phospholipid/cholesterol/gamma-HCH transport system ATP-binding protein